MEVYVLNLLIYLFTVLFLHRINKNAALLSNYEVI